MNTTSLTVSMRTTDEAVVSKIVEDATAIAFNDKDFAKHFNAPVFIPVDAAEIASTRFELSERFSAVYHMAHSLASAAELHGVEWIAIPENQDDVEFTDIEDLVVASEMFARPLGQGICLPVFNITNGSEMECENDFVYRVEVLDEFPNWHYFRAASYRCG